MSRRALFPVVVLLLVGLFAFPASGGSLEDELKEVRQSMLALAAQIDDIAADRSMLARDVRDSEGKLDEIETQIAAASARLDRVRAEHSERAETLADVRSDLADRFAREG